MREKVAYIAPGYPNSTEADNYQEVGSFFEDNGFEVEYIDPDWSTDMEENLEQFSQLVEEATQKYGEHEKYFFGHSLGAMCLFTVSPEFEPKAKIMASMSPEFKEEHELNARWAIKAGRIFNRISGLFSEPLSMDYDRPKLEDIDVTGDIYFMYAEREYYGFFGIDSLGFGRETTEKRLEMFPEAEKIVVEGAKHQMTSDEYLGEIEDVIDEL
ncbi:MAG: hypothetical protein ABEK16_03205 [Candidatus Nanohalobium sp.]